MHWKRMICLCLSALLLLALFPPVLAAEETGAEAEPVPAAEAIGAEAEPVPAAEATETETEPPTPEEQLLEMLDREQTEAPAAQTPDEEIVSLPEIGIEHFRLGCASEMMLAGGGRMVSAPEGLYFLAEADDSIWLTGGEGARCILAEPAACLNYIDGKLIYAAPAEDSFSVWRLDPASGERACLLDSFPGRPSQLYAADDGRIWFLAGDAIWRVTPENAPERLCGADDLVSFAPTGYGMVYARGALFDLTLWLPSAARTCSSPWPRSLPARTIARNLPASTSRSPWRCLRKLFRSCRRRSMFPWSPRACRPARPDLWRTPPRPRPRRGRSTSPCAPTR